MRRHTRYLLAFGSVVGGGLLLWTGHAFGSHGTGRLHTCVSQAGTIRVAQSCQALESAVVLVREEALTNIEARLAALEAKAAQVDALKGRVGDLENKVGALETTLAGVTRSGDNLTFSGMNVQVVNGLGGTDTENRLGNLIIGYNEETFDGSERRTGSHNLIIGSGHSYMSYGGLVAGNNNRLMGPFASVSGGSQNDALGSVSSVSGGTNNTASQVGSSVSGGVRNTASGDWSSVSGGYQRTANGESDWRAGSLFEDQ